MHGFTDNAKNYAETLLPMLSAELGSSEQPPDAHERFVFLQAPQRRISCYGEPRLSGHMSRLVLLGQSQGSCCAIDAALTYKDCLGGLFCSIGQVRSRLMACDGR